MTSSPESPRGGAVPFREALGVWFRIGLMSFGGPAGQIALMHRMIVEERRWIGNAQFAHALSFCMLLPGPEAQQLATYIGWLLHGVRGGLVAGTLFILPGALVVLGLSIVYALYQEVVLVQAIFYGIKAAVLAIVLDAMLRLARRALEGPAHLALAISAFAALFILQAPFPAVIAAAVGVGLIRARALPRTEAAPSAEAATHNGTGAIVLACLAGWLAPLALLIGLLGWDHVYSQIAFFFSKMAVVTFGGAYAALSYVAQQAVDGYGWLAAGEMLDGLGLAETTPGPLILVLQFVGFLAAYRNPGPIDPILAGTLGAGLATWVTFVPCFLWIFLGAPFVERLRRYRLLTEALRAITAAVVGVILNLATWFGLHVLFTELTAWRVLGLSISVPAWDSLDPGALAIAAAALIALTRFRLELPLVLLAASLLGAAYRLAA